jgi:hypothetical protein
VLVYAYERRAILTKAFMEDLPNVGSARYMARWGMPGSAQRLKRIAYHLWSVSGFSKDREADYSLAREEWESDLQWLKVTFYDNGGYDFSWSLLGWCVNRKM